MAHIYIPPPTKTQMAHEFAESMASLFRIKVSVTLDNGERDTSTVIVDKRHQATPPEPK